MCVIPSDIKWCNSINIYLISKIPTDSEVWNRCASLGGLKNDCDKYRARQFFQCLGWVEGWLVKSVLTASNKESWRIVYINAKIIISYPMHLRYALFGPVKYTGYGKIPYPWKFPYHGNFPYPWFLCEYLHDVMSGLLYPEIFHILWKCPYPEIFHILEILNILEMFHILENILNMSYLRTLSKASMHKSDWQKKTNISSRIKSVRFRTLLIAYIPEPLTPAPTY